jgi:hypothetical protein
MAKVDVTIQNACEVTASFDGLNISVGVTFPSPVTVEVFLFHSPTATITIDDDVTELSANPVKSAGIWTFVVAAVTAAYNALVILINNVATALNNHITATANAHPSSAITNLHAYLADLADCACPISLDSLTFVVDSPTQATITAVASGGVGTLTYSLIFGGVVVQENTTGIFIVNDAGTYTVEVNDEVGSTPDSNTVAVAFLDADLLVYLGALTTPLSAAQQTKLDTLVKSLKTGLGITNLSDAFDVIYVFGNETAESGLKNLVKRLHDATPVNAPTFTALEGYQGNGSDQYINCNYIASTQGAAYQLNSASAGIYSRTNIQLNTYDYGVNSGLAKYLRQTIYNTIAGRTETRINQGNVNTFYDGDTDSLGLFTGSRDDVDTIRMYKNATLRHTATPVSTDFPDRTVFIMCRNSSGSPADYTTRQYSFFFIGKSFSQANITTIYNAIQSYMTSNGKQV